MLFKIFHFQNFIFDISCALNWEKSLENQFESVPIIDIVLAADTVWLKSLVKPFVQT